MALAGLCPYRDEPSHKPQTDPPEQVQAIRAQVDEVRAEFDGEDVLIPYVRGALDAADEELRELKREIEPLAGEVALPEPTDVLRGHVRTIFEREHD